jgi:cytochrome c oxidase subunit 2
VRELYSSVASVLHPASPLARDIGNLFWVTFWISAVILVLVGAFVISNMIRFRDRGDDDALPPQIRGNTAVEITWTVIPLAILAVVFVLSMGTMARVTPRQDAPVDIEVTAHQWWWEVHYPGAGVTTANEIHLPAGRPIHVRLSSADVIHDLWVPELGRKMDAVPGHANSMLLQADHPGVYLGACAEYCGAEHAWMRVRVVAQAPGDFQRWLSAEAQPKPSPTSDLAKEGERLFADKTCASCHVVQGGPRLPASVVGPDLTHLGSRATLAAGVVANTPAALRSWLADPDATKPGSYMPNLHLNGHELDALVAYLEETP